MAIWLNYKAERMKNQFYGTDDAFLNNRPKPEKDTPEIPSEFGGHHTEL
ncbi:MAG: hypothetical protein QME51_10220 [Planctomycetota bacterium]|nr:hypothetical protein [Planctomycetota bacterium]